MPASPTLITDEILLGLIVSGDLVINDIESPDPVLVFKGNIIKAELTRQRGRGRIEGTERWTWRICHEGKRRRIVRAKLVWMFHHRAIVEHGCKVHHGRGGRLHDGIGNLTKMTDAEHNQFHYGCILDRGFDDVSF